MSTLRYTGATLLLLAFALTSGCSGSECSVTENADGSASISCTDGTSAVVRDGVDGSSCTVSDVGDGDKLIECEDGTTVTVSDGTDGMNGADGSPGTPGDAGTSIYASGPGLEVELMEAAIDTATRTPYAVFRFTDAEGMPLDREGRSTEGAVGVRFTVAYLPTEMRLDGEVVLPYVNYITREVMNSDGSVTMTQPTTDSDGTWTAVDFDDGVYRYDFGTVLPEDYDATRTHTIGYFASRTYAGVRYVADGAPSFRPDGMDVTETRDIVTNAACNNCHTPLSFHGGQRENVTLCATCHATGYGDPDTGNTIDFQTMVHKIHRGSDLPSVQNGVDYFFVGYMGHVADYSDVEFPQDVRNCDTCHDGADGQNWNTVPSQDSCGSCHDDIWFGAGDPPESWQRLHDGGTRPDNDRCTTCHNTTGAGGVSPIVDRHWYKHNNPANPVVELTIDATRVNGSDFIEADFTVVVDGAPRDIATSPLDRLRFRIAGPTSDYAFEVDENVTVGSGVTAINAAMGQFRYTSSDTLTTIATDNSVPAEGSWAVGVEAGLNSATDGRMPSNNPVAVLEISGTATPRRAIVTTAACNTCHQPLGAHGDNRVEPDYCAMCHNPELVQTRDLPAMGPYTAVSQGMGPMVHRIHASSDIEYPAALVACEQCHIDGTTSLPLPETAGSYLIREVDAAGTSTDVRLSPAAATCGGCHSSASAMAHFETNTTASGGEACGTCHGDGGMLSVEAAHARPEYLFR